MTAQIIPFPQQSDLDWAAVENKIHTALAGMSGDPALQAEVAGRLMAFVRNYACKTFEPFFNLPLPPMTDAQRQAFLLALDQGFAAVKQQIQDMVNKIIMERLLREVEIYEEKLQVDKPDILGRVPAIFALLPDGQREKIGYLVYQLKKPDLSPPEKYLLNKLLEAVLATGANADCAK